MEGGSDPLMTPEASPPRRLSSCQWPSSSSCGGEAGAGRVGELRALRRGRPGGPRAWPPLTHEERCPGLDVPTAAVQAAEGLCQGDAEPLLAVAHLGSTPVTRWGQRAGPADHGPEPQPRGAQLLAPLPSHPPPRPRTRQLQRKWLAPRLASQASTQERVCRSRTAVEGELGLLGGPQGRARAGVGSEEAAAWARPLLCSFPLPVRLRSAGPPPWLWHQTLLSPYWLGHWPLLSISLASGSSRKAKLRLSGLVWGTGWHTVGLSPYLSKFNEQPEPRLQARRWGHSSEQDRQCPDHRRHGHVFARVCECTCVHMGRGRETKEGAKPAAPGSTPCHPQTPSPLPPATRGSPAPPRRRPIGRH